MGIAAMLATAYLTCGDLSFRMTVILSIVWIGGPLLFAMVVVGFYRTRDHGWHAWRPAGWTLTAVVILFATQSLSKQVLHWEEARAHQYPAQVETELEQFHQAKGRYPVTLDELAPKTPPPRLIRYLADDDGYSFSIRPHGFFGGGDYDRKTRQWTSND